MEQRQTQITEGAGLQESRLNQDFIDWLNKWGPRILTGVLILLLLWVGRRYLQDREVKARDAALFQYDQARVSGSPDALLGVARDQRRFVSVYSMATLDAANIHLQSARRGVAIEGDPENPEDLLTEAQRAEALAAAKSLFQDIDNRTRGREPMVMHRISARWGLAAVALTERDFDGARELLRSVADMAAAAHMAQLARTARERLERIDELEQMPPLYSQSEIASLTRVQMTGPDMSTLMDQSLSDLDFGPFPPDMPLDEEPDPEADDESFQPVPTLPPTEAPTQETPPSGR